MLMMRRQFALRFGLQQHRNNISHGGAVSWIPASAQQCNPKN